MVRIGSGAVQDTKGLSQRVCAKYNHCSFAAMDPLQFVDKYSSPADQEMAAFVSAALAYGQGSDIMVPMAIPSFGGMLLAVVSIFLVPVLYCWTKENSVDKSS